MRSLLTSLFFLIGCITFAQVGIGTTDPSDAAMLEVSSSTDGTNFKGFMPPRVSSIAERTTINPGVDDVGLLIFLADATNGNYCLQIWGGTAWEDVYCLSSPVIGSEVYYTVSSQTLSEGSGRVDLQFTIDNPSPTDAITITIDADDYTDLIESAAQTVIIPANTTAYTAAVFSIDDDTTVEAAEDVEFTISTISGGLGTATIGTPSVHTLTILDDDGTSALPYTESFETDGSGVRYALSETQAIDAGDDDYFSRARLSDFPYTGNNTVSFLGSPDGDYFFAAQDIDGVPGYSSATQTLTITGIDITGGINLEMDVLLAEDDDATNQDWDSGDLVTFEYQIDGGGYQNLLQIASTGATNTEPAIDTDFDGVGDGTVLTETWADFNASITGTGTTLDIRITFTLNADDEDIGIDNIRITSN
ncbi:hypothetical protein [Gilvibacter sp.]|uniref:hypothetical protein n=1 Tax=Gilvibacter sp. TaxID=2729997 RepID=UPI003F4A76C1